MPSLPLSDITVLDLSEGVSGSYCTKLLSQFGANVIKIERPDTGDISRSFGPFPGNIPNQEASGIYLYLNTGKKTVTLEWRTKSGYEILKRLLKSVDMLVENYTPGTIDFQELHSLNDALVVISISYFGQDGIYHSFKGSDMVAQAISGIMKLTGTPDREPLKIAGFQAEYQAGINAAIAAMGALLHRDATGEGQQIDVSIMECLASILEGDLLSYAYNGIERERAGARHPTVYPSTILPCQDGYLHVDAGADWDTFVRFLGIAELGEIDSNEARQHADELDTLLIRWLSGLPKTDVFHQAQGWRLPFAEVKSIDEVFSDPQLRARSFFINIEHPVAGNLAYPGHPFNLTGCTGKPETAPSLGEDNQEIYGEWLGYTDQEIVQLHGMGII